MRTYNGQVSEEDHARLLLLGLDALPFRERWLLCWLLDRPNRMSIAFEEVSELSSCEFSELCCRWRELGLIGGAYSETYDANLWQATDLAAMVAGLIPATDGLVFTSTPVIVEPVDLDAMELAA
ncbi:hypothetical protein [Nocardia sp. NBC_01009]|uniref:hypothetical protein n=1 Tax=Nocardia sp. NBC_01009 TaxID=2975996 RepID=UPI003869FE91|nr:hypothetical protein OHA42_15280 [Nocardia sp. NBC_01009]